jgi:hypothetical protein
MAHRFFFLGLMVFGFAIGTSAVPAPAADVTPAPAYPGGPGCQKDTGAAAWLAPCVGPEGTVITGTAPPMTAQVQPSTGGGFTFVVPLGSAGTCPHNGR